VNLLRKSNKRCLPFILSLLLILLFAVVSASETIIADNDHVMSAGSAVLINDIRVIIDAAPEQQKVYAALARRLIRLGAGDALTESALQESIKILRLSRRFSAIHVDSISESKGETLIFTLTPSQYIKDIRIQGNYPLFESDILSQMTLYPGDPFNSEDLAAQSEAVATRFRLEGYIHPKVSALAMQDSEGEDRVILVDIHKGPHLQLGAVRFIGNKTFSSTRLKWQMKIWRGSLVPGIGRFSEYNLNKDVETLREYYWKNRFADAEVSWKIERKQDSRIVDVIMDIREGPRYEVSFSGNNRFWDMTLERDVVLSIYGNQGKIGVRKSIQNLKRRYQEAGFSDVQIKTEGTDGFDNGTNIRQLRFVIDEGVGTFVKSVDIVGNTNLSEYQIRKQLLSRPATLFHNGVFVPGILDEDIYAVTTLYQMLGFQECTVESELYFSEDKSSVAVVLKINEGSRAVVQSLSIKGLTATQENESRKMLLHKTGASFVSTALAAEKEAVINMLSKKGYPYTTVQTDVSYSEDHSHADIVYTVSPGSQVTLRDIFISGNLRTAEKIIRRELEVQPQAPLSLWALYDGQRRLRDMEIFHEVRYNPVGLKEKSSAIDLFVEVEEAKPYYGQVSIGYESNSGIFSRSKIGDRNILGLNKNIWVNGELSQTGYRIESRLLEPRFFGTVTSASIGAYDEEMVEFNQPFGTRTTGGSMGFDRGWGKHMHSTLSMRLEKRDSFNVEDLHSAERDDLARTIFVTTPSIRYDSRDSFVRPANGMYSSLSVDVSKGVQNQLDDYFRYLFDIRFYRTPSEGMTIAGLVRIGQVVAYAGDDLVPADQLFFAGGIGDVRGFKENMLRLDNAGDPVGGRTVMVGSLEARVDLGMNFELTTFFDLGSVQDAPDDAGSNQFRSSVGIGLRYITPIGPMGLLYGYKLNRTPGETAGRFHLSIGYSF
jgi:outer membrane protein insertion porin family